MSDPARVSDAPRVDWSYRGCLIVLVLVGALVLWARLPTPVTREFDVHSSAVIAVAFADRERLLGDESPTLESGEWTVEEVRARLDELRFPFSDGSTPRWSTAVLFGRMFGSTLLGQNAEAIAREEFLSAGLEDEKVVSDLVRWLNTPGTQLVVFDRYEERRIIAHLWLNVPQQDQPVVVFRSTATDR